MRTMSHQLQVDMARSTRRKIQEDKGRILKLVSKKKGVLLDISFGGEPQPRALTLRPTGDVPQDPTHLPLNLPDSCVHTAVVTHVLDFVEPQNIFKWFDELHRVMQHNAVALFSGPYGGDESQGWLSDPTHRTRIIEQTFAWLDPRTPFYALHESIGRPQPKPWLTIGIARVPGAHGTCSYNATMQVVKQ